MQDALHVSVFMWSWTCWCLVSQEGRVALSLGGPWLGRVKLEATVVSVMMFIRGPSRQHYLSSASPIGCRAAGLFSDWLASQLHSLPMCAACEQLSTCFSSFIHLLFSVYLLTSCVITVTFYKRRFLSEEDLDSSLCPGNVFEKDSWKFVCPRHSTGCPVKYKAC